MKYYNFFKNRLLFFLLLLFVMLSVVQIIYAALTYRGLVIDGIMFFVKILNSLSENGYGFVLCPQRARAFILAINQLPVNIAYWLGIISKTVLAAIFSLPLFLFPFLVTMYNFVLAKRTKRYDIVLLGLILYNLLILPSIMYSVVEVFLASTLIVVLLHYYLADIDYTKKDILIIILLSILLYESTELSVLIYTIIVLFPLKAKTTKSKIVKWFINISLLLSSCFIIYMTYVVIGVNHTDIEYESVSFFRELIQDRSNLFLCLIKEPYLIEIITGIFLILLLFYKKRLKFPVIILITLIYSGIFGFMLKNADIYFYHFHYVSYRVFIFIILPILVLFLFLSERLKKFIHKNVLYNLFVIVLISGIINICIDLVYSNKVHQLQITYNKTISGINKKFLDPDTDLEKIFFMDNIYFSILTPESYYLVFSKEYKQEKLILPSQSKEIADCFRILDFDKNLLYLFFINIDIKNKFWDLTEIGKEFEKNETFRRLYKRNMD